MKRRSFFELLAGLFAARALPPVWAELPEGEWVAVDAADVQRVGQIYSTQMGAYRYGVRRGWLSAAEVRAKENTWDS